MTDKLFFEIVMVFIVFMVFVFFNIIKKLFFKTIKIDDIRKSLEHIKNQKAISVNLKKLAKCNNHLELSMLLVELHQSLDYFDQYNINILDRPPSKLRETVDVYSSALIERIYISKNEEELEIKEEEDLGFLEEGENEDEKKERKERRAKYKRQKQEKENLEFLHGKRKIEEYLDIDYMHKLQKLKL